ncbi:MAG TPA: NAD(P)/FAD-dependent oxidoreductase [Chthoniobacteraceae bacterium]|nr:NAD(P)/FAD-dependent oxidoreductase [Chthoniobacteraceae bacterium]
MSKEYDFVVIGGGSAGYAAASTASKAGLSVAVIEGGEEVGGLCILRGCMPSKALLESAKRFDAMRRAAEFGLHAENLSFRGEEIIARKKRLIGGFAGYRREQLESGKFDFIRGMAGFVDAHTVEVVSLQNERTQIKGRSFLIATGSTENFVPVPGLAETGYLDSDAVLDSAEIPDSVIVLGGGAVAMEFSQYYAALGKQVTIIQRGEQVLRDADTDVAVALVKAYEKRGVNVYLKTGLLRAERHGATKRVWFRHDGAEKNVEAAEIIYALGRKAQIQGLNLERAGVALARRGHIACGMTQQTNVSHIFGAGDVVGPHEIVHLAVQQGETAARNAAKILRGDAGPMEQLDYRLKLFAVFSEPQVAFVGATEKELRGDGIPHASACYPFYDHGKSMLMDEIDGFVKLIVAEKSREILGAAVIGPHASDLIHEIVVAMHFRATAGDLARVPHYHPTLSEIWTYPAEELAGA